MPPSRDGGIFFGALGGFKRQRLTPKFVGFCSTWAGPGSAKLVHFKNQSHGPPSPDGGQIVSITTDTKANAWRIVAGCAPAKTRLRSILTAMFNRSYPIKPFNRVARL